VLRERRRRLAAVAGRCERDAGPAHHFGESSSTSSSTGSANPLICSTSACAYRLTVGSSEPRAEHVSRIVAHADLDQSIGCARGSGLMLPRIDRAVRLLLTPIGERLLRLAALVETVPDVTPASNRPPPSSGYSLRRHASALDTSNLPGASISIDLTTPSS